MTKPALCSGRDQEPEAVNPDSGLIVHMRMHLSSIISFRTCVERATIVMNADSPSDLAEVSKYFVLTKRIETSSKEDGQ